MSERHPIVVFKLDGQRYGLYKVSVARIVRGVSMTRLRRSPAPVMGVINAQGEVVPVVNLRQRFRLPERDLRPSGQLIIARTSRLTVGLVVDTVVGVTECSEDDLIAAARDACGGDGAIVGVVRMPDGLVLIHDLDMFLSVVKEQAMEAALEGPSS